MTHDLIDTVSELLTAAGYGADCGLHLHRYPYGVIVTWDVGPLVRTTVRAHATESDVTTRASMPGIRMALSTALTSLLDEVGLRAIPHPDGFILARYPGHRRSPRTGLDPADPGDDARPDEVRRAVTAGPARAAGGDGTRVRFLASDQASYITGDIVNATGGTPLQ